MTKIKVKTSAEEDLIILILLVGTFYAHRTILTRLLVYSVSICLFLFVCFIFFKLYRKFKFINKNRTLVEVDKMSGIEFEIYVAKLLRENGYTGVRLTEKYDYGIDIIAKKDGVTWGIQTKRYSSLVKASAVRQVVTALPYYGCDKAMVITNSYFSKVAVTLAKCNDCILKDRSKLRSISQEKY